MSNEVKQEPVAYTNGEEIILAKHWTANEPPTGWLKLVFPTSPQPAQQEPVDIAALVEGMEVSIDVSTGDHDSGNRLFGTVTLAQENQGSKHGLILLVQDPEANFKTAAPQPAPVQQCMDHGECFGGKCIYPAPQPAQRTWVGLNEDQRQQVRSICDADIPAHVFHAIEAKLKEKNT